MNQSKASDSWAYFQAKAIKEDLYKMQSEKLEMEISSKDQITADVYNNKLKEYKLKIEKYEKEKGEAKIIAEKFENDRDIAQLHAKDFGMAVIFLQVTILLSTISGLMKKKNIWYFSLGCGLVGLIFFANGFLLFLE